MVWDWRSFHSLVPKVASFGVGHEEEREHKDTHKAAGVDNGLRRLRWSSSKGVLRPLQPHSWCPHTKEETGEKKNPPPTSQKVDIFIPPWYTVYAEGRQGFSIDLWGLLTTFRASEVYGSCISRICGFCEFSRQCVLLWLFSLVALQHHLSKRQRHRRLTSAAFGDIIKLQNRRGGSLPKGR